MKQATIKDIARAANVSYATVSRALNNKYGVRVRTRERIRRIAAELGYRPNAIARGLVKKRSFTLGLVLPDIANPFFPEVVEGIEKAAVGSGYSVLLCNTNWDAEREESYVRLLSERRVDGILVSPIADERGRFEALLDQLGVPAVHVSNAPKGTSRSYVIIDDVQGGFLATRHLIEQGYERVGFIGPATGGVTVDDRFLGYKRALEEHGFPVDDRLIWLHDFRSRSGYLTIRRMIQTKAFPRAVFAANDLLAVGILQGVREEGLRVPDDIAVVGFDDIELARMFGVGLTTVAQPKREMGRIAVELLLEAIDAGKGALARHVVLQPRLVVRSSSTSARTATVS
jgi:LacI family transcriptional regulator